MTDINNEELKELPNIFIKDSFYCENKEIIIVDNKLFNGKANEDSLIMLKVIINENGERVLVHLEDDEYEKAYNKYVEMLELLGESNNE